MVFSKPVIKCNNKDDPLIDLMQKLKPSSEFNNSWENSDPFDHLLTSIDGHLIDRIGYVSPLTFLTAVPKGLRIASLNVRSLMKNESKVIDFLEHTNLHVLALQEIWTSDGRLMKFG